MPTPFPFQALSDILILQNPMDKISIYDIANDVWYTQQATGDIPTWRMSGCSVVAAAPDKSSFSM